MPYDEHELTGEEDHLRPLGSMKCDDLIPNT